MFDIGWTEMLLVAVVAIVVVGPKELPGMLRNLGRGMRAVRRMASDFQGQFNDALKEAELDEVRDEFNKFRNSARNYTHMTDFSSIARDEIKGAIEGKPSTMPSISPTQQPAVLPAALPEPQLPVMQEPVIDSAPPVAVKRRKTAATKVVEKTADAKPKPKSKAPVNKTVPKPAAKLKAPRKSSAAKPAAPSDEAS